MTGLKWHHHFRLRAPWLANVDVNAKFSTSIAPPTAEILQSCGEVYLSCDSFLEDKRGILRNSTGLARDWNRQRWRRIFTRRRPKEEFPKRSRLSHTTADSTNLSSSKNLKWKVLKQSQQETSSMAIIEPTLHSLLFERVDRQVDSIEGKENIVYTIEAGVNNQTKMETTENIGIEPPTLSTCGLFDDLGKMKFDNLI